MFKSIVIITLSMWLLQVLIAPGPRNNHELATVRDVIAEILTRLPLLS